MATEQVAVRFGQCMYEVPLGNTAAFMASVCLYYLGNYGHAWS